MEEHEKQYFEHKYERDKKTRIDFIEKQKSLKYDIRPYKSGFYEATLDEIEKQRFDRDELQRIPRAKLEVMKEYQ